MQAGIIRRAQLKEGEDEQFLADLSISILEQIPFGFSGSSLDAYYETPSDESVQINKLLTAYGGDSLRNGILTTISIIRDVIEGVDPAPNALRRIIHPDAGGNPIKTGFFAIFMAFFDLCIREGKSPTNGAAILGALNGLQGKLNVAAGQIRSESRQQNIDVTKGLIQAHFVEPARCPARKWVEDSIRECSSAIKDRVKRLRVQTRVA